MNVSRRVDSSDDSLSARFFVTCSAVDLASIEEAANSLGLQRGPEFGWVNHIVLNGIAGAEHHCVLKAGNLVDQLSLQIGGKAGRKAVQVDFVGVITLRFEKKLMAIFVREFDHLVFD
ncbi:MAG: hypothetical protein JMDDDDMK_03746 [Acidobacteria bacterium]|nr:hypothetical protein [Acidobacteriota bacterium]